MSKDKNEIDFSKKFEELEEIVAWFDGDVENVEESLKKFERGVTLSKELKEYLESAENKVEKIKAQFDSV